MGRGCAQCRREREIGAAAGTQHLRSQAAPICCMRLEDVTLAALSALCTHRHGEKREPRHDAFERGRNAIFLISTGRVLRRWCIIRLILRGVLLFIALHGLLPLIRCALILQRKRILRVIRYIAIALLRHIRVVRRWLLFLLRTAHPMHEYELRCLLHIHGHNECSARERRKRTRRLDEIDLRMVSDTVRTQDAGGRKVQNGRRHRHARQELTCTANRGCKFLLLRGIGRTKRRRVALKGEHPCGDLPALCRVSHILHRHKKPEGIQQRGAERPLCRIHRTDRGIGNFFGK